MSFFLPLFDSIYKAESEFLNVARTRHVVGKTLVLAIPKAAAFAASEAADIRPGPRGFVLPLPF